jgi:TPR repeat protein
MNQLMTTTFLSSETDIKTSLRLQPFKNRIRRTATKNFSISKPSNFQLDAKPISRRALLRAAGMGMFWLLVLCLVPTLKASSAQSSDVIEIKRKAKLGDAQSQYLLGRMYENGDRVHENFVKAAKWYRKAAEQNLVQGQYRLGAMYVTGLGLRQNYAEAMQWFRKAAAQGHASAQNRLGVMYERGHGVAQDYIEAYKWYTLAAAGDQHIFGVANREVLARRLTRDQIAEGERRAAIVVALTSSSQPGR